MDKIIKLTKKTDIWVGRNYYCKITDHLDLFLKTENPIFRHYIMTDNDPVTGKRFYAIRVPGGTVGYIQLDDHNVIEKIFIDRDYVVKSYPLHINAIMEEYVGYKLEIPPDDDTDVRN